MARDRVAGDGPLERTRRRFARRQRLRRWLAWRPVLLAALAIALVGGGIYLVYFSPALEVTGAEVVGTTTLDPELVERTAQVPTGGPLATVDLDAVARRVESLAAVKSVDVSRQWPHEVRIEVTERTPVAVVERGGSLRAVDSEGQVFNSYRRAPDDLPLIRTSVSDSEALQEAAAVAAALPPEIALLTTYLELVSRDEINLELTGDREVRWGSSEESAQKAEVLVALLDQPGTVYDVSVPGQPTVAD